jgi:hypothetical protein
MTYLTKLFAMFGKAPKTESAPAAPVHVTPEPPATPEISPRDALNAPPPAGE